MSALAAFSTRRVVDEVVLHIPEPPSVNQLFLNVPGKGRVKSRAYRQWIKEADKHLMVARPGRIDGRYTYELALSDKTRKDAENCLKAAGDLLVRNGIVEDDGPKFCRGVSAHLEAGLTMARVTVRRTA